MIQDKSFKYDVFISYGHKDKEWVKKSLVPKLEATKLRVCLDNTTFTLGEPVAAQVEKAIKESKYTIIVLTPDYVKSYWTAFENMLVNSVNSENRQKRVIPILLRECELPLRIQNLACLDFTEGKKEQLSEFERFFRLIAKKKDEKQSPKQSKYFEYNLIKLNDFCSKSFSDREIINLSYDHFISAYENISLGMSKEAKVRLVLEYCERYQMVDELIDVIKKHRPELSDQIDEVIKDHDLE